MRIGVDGKSGMSDNQTVERMNPDKPDKTMTTLQINQENSRIQGIKSILQNQYREEFGRMNEGGNDDRLKVIREEIKSVESRISENWNLHG